MAFLLDLEKLALLWVRHCLFLSKTLSTLIFFMITFGVIAFIGMIWTLATLPNYTVEDLVEMAELDDIRSLIVLYPKKRLSEEYR